MLKFNIVDVGRWWGCAWHIKTSKCCINIKWITIIYELKLEALSTSREINGKNT